MRVVPKTQEAIRLQQLHDDLQNKYGRSPTDDEWAAAAGKMNVLAIQEDRRWYGCQESIGSK